VRKVDQALSVTEASFLKVPFDLAYWQRAASEKYPGGLVKPYSNDLTQWLFDGHPRGSADPNVVPDNITNPRLGSLRPGNRQLAGPRPPPRNRQIRRRRPGFCRACSHLLLIGLRRHDDFNLAHVTWHRNFFRPSRGVVALRRAAIGLRRTTSPSSGLRR
jgi:hypothetical protein